MKTKKFFALILSALLCISMIPFAAFAEGFDTGAESPVTALPDAQAFSAAYMMDNPAYKVSNGLDTSDANGMKLEQEATSALADDFTKILKTSKGILFRLDNTAASNTEHTYISFVFTFSYKDEGGETKTAALCSDLHRALARGKFSDKASYNGTVTTWYMTKDNGTTWSEINYEYNDGTDGSERTSGWTCQKVTEEKINAYIFIPAEAMVCDRDLNNDGKLDTLAEISAMDSFTITKMSAAANNPTMKAAASFATDFMFITAPKSAAPAQKPVKSLPESCNFSAVYMTQNPEFKVTNGSTAEGGMDENSMKLEKANKKALAADFTDNFKVADGILLKYDISATTSDAKMAFSIDFFITGTNKAGEAIETKFCTNATRAAAHNGGGSNSPVAAGTVSIWYVTTDNGASWTPVTQTYDGASVGYNCMQVTDQKGIGYIYIPFTSMYARDDHNGDGLADTYADLAEAMGEDFVVTTMYVGANLATMKEASAYLTDFMLVKQNGTHKWDAGVDTKAPTHLEFGLKKFTCSDCGAQREEATEKTPDHTFDLFSPWDENEHMVSCECGENTTAPHNWNDGVITTEPTVDTEGVKTYTCEDCRDTKTEAVAKLDPPADDGSGTENPPVDDNTDTNPPAEQTPAPTTPAEEDGGCGSVVSTGAAMIVALAGAMLISKKKRK